MTQEKKKHVFPYAILGKLTRNSIILDLLICLLLFALYLIGNFQAFTDITQLRILKVLGITAAVLSVLSFLGIVQEIVFIFMKNRKTPAFFMIIFFIFSLIIGVALIGFSVVIRRIAMGI
ncbi:MAG: hypothetical protein IKX70_06530 [Treponema sp.]|nr:hypothetical protein [Treponema sp.]MBR5033305.1 hypothetical protein [Treponema sp.]